MALASSAAGFRFGGFDMAKASNAIPKGHHTVTPSLTFDGNAAQAIFDFLAEKRLV